MNNEMLNFDQLIRGKEGRVVKVVDCGRNGEPKELELKVRFIDGHVNLISDDEKHSYGVVNNDLINQGIWIDIYAI